MVKKLACLGLLFKNVQKPLVVEGRMVEKLDCISLVFNKHVQKPLVFDGRMVKKLACIGVFF